MSQFKKGAAALGALTTSNEGGKRAEITSFKSGTTFKVRVKGTADLMQYYNYGIFKKVNSFVPKMPAERNERGFITANPTPWDRASQYYYDLAKNTDDAAKKQSIQQQGYVYKGKEKFIYGFHNIETGEDFIVDLTKAQALTVYEAIKKYEKRIGKVAFELSKTGESTGVKVSLTPIIDMEEDLTDKERENFEKAEGHPFDTALFDGVLFELDEKAQIDALVTSGFDLKLIGLTPVPDVNGEVVPIEDDPTSEF